MNVSKLPQTDSIQELARFWDSHDVTEFDDELEEVSEPVFERETIVAVRLSSEETNAVSRIAQAKGVADAELIHAWVAEKVRGE